MYLTLLGSGVELWLSSSTVTVSSEQAIAQLLGSWRANTLSRVGELTTASVLNERALGRYSLYLLFHESP